MIDVLDALTIARLFWQDDPHDAIMRRNLNISRDSSNLESCSEKKSENLCVERDTASFSDFAVAAEQC